MRKNILLAGCMLSLVLIMLLSCKIDTAYGPTPYSLPKQPIENLTSEKYLTAYVDSVVGTKSVSDSLAKAASSLPSLQQAYVDMKFGMFIHFNMSTFDRCCCPTCKSVQGEWGNAASATVVPNLFKPSKLNVGQWVRVAKSAGMKYMVLTSKHHDGFCIWPTRWTDHSVKKSSWGDGKRDVIREFADSLRANDIKVGLYYSIWDKTNGSKVPFIKAQLTELLTNYGPISELYFDGWKWMVGYNLVPYDTIRNLIKTLQPNCLIMENNHYFSLTNTDVVTYEVPVDKFPQAGNTLPSEAAQTLRLDDCWFWHPEDECNLMSAQDIVGDIKMCNERNTSYMLDLTPDTLGLMPQCVADRMAEVGALRGITP